MIQNELHTAHAAAHNGNPPRSYDLAKVLNGTADLDAPQDNPLEPLLNWLEGRRL